MNQKVILAYSGGLDTSVMLHWLVIKGYEVIAYIADVGQKEDFQQLKEKALQTGATKVYIEDLKKDFLETYIFQMLKANAVYEGQYLLGTAIARPIIAKKQVDIANKEGTTILAHGCTGKGNDQIRFELIWMQCMPNVQIISPWKQDDWLKQFKGRNDMITYALQHHLPCDVTEKKPYSMDENLMHISYEAGILENPKNKPNETMFKLTTSPQHAPNKETQLSITFQKGIPIKITNLTDTVEISEPLPLFTYLNTLAGQNGIGRIDIVENRFIGMKSRGVYETPAGTVLLKAHKDLESITVDKEVLSLKEMLSPLIGKLIYNGLWFSPEMDFLMAAINKSQENVTGTVYLTLYKGNIIITGREAPHSLYNEALSSMEKDGGYDQKDAAGFIKIQGLRLKLGGPLNETLGKKLPPKQIY